MSHEHDWLDLDEDEDMVWSGIPRIQTLYSVIGFAFAIVIAPTLVIGWEGGLAGLVVGVAVFALAYLYLINTEFVVTTKYAYSKRGIYGRSITKIGLKNIQDTSFNQGLLARQFDYGTLFFSTAGGTGNELSFKHIDKPREVQSKINKQLQALRSTKTSQGSNSTDSGASDELLTELTEEMKRMRETINEINAHFNTPSERDD